jgi:hypothetical protein
MTTDARYGWRENKLMNAISMVDATLNKLKSETCRLSHEKSYTDAILDLQGAMQTYCTGGIFAGIMSWPVGLGDEMINLIEIKEPLALAILAHYGVVFHLLRDRWWARNTGKRLVRSILPILQQSKPEWAGLVQQAWVAVVNDCSFQNTPLEKDL